ncbi:MAG TPA: hypothetical protein VJT14_16475 [Candidatus Dormibacteraeota bacterium]|nr:hypothetical protein [Candidatus Dormibacteraeota bacterium]
MPLPLLPLVGACAGCRLLLLVVELEFVVVVAGVVPVNAVLETLADDLPAYEAAAM